MAAGAHVFGGRLDFSKLKIDRPERRRGAVEPSASFFDPHDSSRAGNRRYGRRGFLQHQCVIPGSDAPAAVAELLREIAASGTGSFLAVLKEFGDRPSLGRVSFPRPGTTLALDLLDRLDAIVAAAGGAVYPAKDARMSGAHFRGAYPRWQEFATHMDPGFSSGFWRRVME